ncbi:MAG: alcohol dehydrogenase catalytic domain-containing protein [Anaerolineaceae bacterium]|nr:alcohol dehydrogenase catalytic domain-containing protein [Anaerolineaceae bacterium]
MKTVILQEPGQFNLVETFPPASPETDEVQVRVRRVGICGTDLHAFTGTQPFFNYPRILGHELAAEIVEIGPTALQHDLKVGDHCCIRPYINCGVCDACRRGVTNACTRLQVLGVHRDGGMRELINVPIDKVHKSTILQDEELAMVEMLSIGCHAVRRANITPGEYVVVVGVGPIGLGVAQFAHLAGAHVIAVDVSESRLAFARQQKAIEQCLDGRQDVLEQFKTVIPDGMPTIVFDATGNPASMMKSFGYVASGGKLVYVGLFQGDITFNDPEFHRRELMILASRNATAQDFKHVMDALETKKIDVKPWVTYSPSPEEMIRDFPMWLDPANGVVKAMFSF